MAKIIRIDCDLIRAPLMVLLLIPCLLAVMCAALCCTPRRLLASQFYAVFVTFYMAGLLGGFVPELEK